MLRAAAYGTAAFTYSFVLMVWAAHVWPVCQ
jgi:hypothetical protein